MADGLTNQLKKALQAKLKTQANEVFFHRAKKAGSNYVIYDLDTVTAEETVQQIELTVNVFGSGDSSVALDDMADNIWAALNHWYYNSGGLIFTVYPTTRGTVVDDANNNNLHRRLVFEIRFYE